MLIFNPSNTAMLGVYGSSNMFYALVICQLILFLLIVSFLGLLSGRLLKLPGATFKRSLLANLCYLGIYILINMAFILFPGTLRSNTILNLINIFIMVFVMSYLYSRFFRSSYIEGILVTLITLVLSFIVLAVYFFIISFIIF